MERTSLLLTDPQSAVSLVRTPPNTLSGRGLPGRIVTTTRFDETRTRGSTGSRELSAPHADPRSQRTSDFWRPTLTLSFTLRLVFRAFDKVGGNFRPFPTRLRGYGKVTDDFDKSRVGW